MNKPEIPTYGNWNEVPDTHKTKTQLRELGYKLLPNQEPVAHVKGSGWHKNKFYGLYTLEQATKKKQATEAQLKALEKARKAHVASWYCLRCEQPLTRRQHQMKSCKDCLRRNKVEVSVAELLKDDFVVLDTETTGLDEPKVIQISVVDKHGKILLDTFVKNRKPIEPDSIEVHGIEEGMLVDAPDWGVVVGQLRKVIEGKKVCCYGLDFDAGAIQNTCEDGEVIPNVGGDDWVCVRRICSIWYGHWSYYFEDYKYKSLTYMAEIFGVPVVDSHTAKGDALMTLNVLKRMVDQSPLPDLKETD